MIKEMGGKFEEPEVTELTEDMLLQKEYIPFAKSESIVSRREQEWINEGIETEQDEEFDWLAEVLYPDQAQIAPSEATKVMDETYVVFINEMRKPMPKDGQAWFCYGNRTNSFLLVNYGFCFQNNLYNSYKFFVKMNVEMNTVGPIKVSDIIASKHQTTHLQ
jgi:hypothetical protein